MINVFLNLSLDQSSEILLKKLLINCFAALQSYAALLFIPFLKVYSFRFPDFVFFGYFCISFEIPLF